MKKFRHRLLCEVLESRWNPAGVAGAFDHIAPELVRLFETGRSEGLMLDGSGGVTVRVTAPDVVAVLPALRGLGYQEYGHAPELYYTEGRLPIAALPQAEALGDGGLLNGVIGVFAPFTNVGAVTSEAVHVMNSEFVSSKVGTGFTGKGINVGIISDSMGRINYPGPDTFGNVGWAADIASGDLPGSVFNGVVREGPATNVIDEGRAMMQLAYDVAPGAGYSFATGAFSEAGMADNVDWLVAQGARVIVDDLTWPEEPIFQPGDITQAYHDAKLAKVVGISSAGNNATNAYDLATIAITSDTVLPGGKFIDFAPTPAVDGRNRVTLPPGCKIGITLQWDDPFYTLNGKGIGTDLNLIALQGDTDTPIIASNRDNQALNMPSEYITFSNPTGTTQTADILVQHFSGLQPGRLILRYVLTPNIAGATPTVEFTGSPSIQGHNGADSVISVAAADFSNQRVAETFTSKGPINYLFSFDGTAVSQAVVINKPDITGPDGTNTTFFGSDTKADPDTRPNFFGTSAAAPHIAGVVALLLEQNPNRTLDDVRNLLTSTARDIGAAGYDTITGHGLVDAFRALYGAQATATVAPGDPLVNNFEVGLGYSWTTYGDVNGRVRIADSTVLAPPANGGSKSLVLDSFYQTAGTKSTTFASFMFNGLAPEITFTFDAKNLGDEADTIDGVYYSVNSGQSYVQLLDLNNVPNAWTPYTFDLHAEAAKAGVPLTASTQIYFFQWDDSSYETVADRDGYAFDNIRIETGADAVTRTWLGGGVTSNWSEPANWSGGTVPAAADVVMIPAGKTVFITAGATAKSVYAYGNLDITGGYVTFSDKLKTYGTVQWDGGAIFGTGIWTTYNSVTWNSGQLGDGNPGRGNLVIGAGKNLTMLTNTGRGIYAGNITNNGNVLWYDGTIYSAFGGTWTNAAGSTFTASANDDHWANNPSYGGTSCAFTMSPTAKFIKDSNNNDIRFDGPLNLDGTVTISTGKISGNGGGDFRTTSITGTVELDGGTFTSTLDNQFVNGFGRVVVNGATLTMPAGKTLNFTNLDLAAGTIRGLGTIVTYTSGIWTGGDFQDAGTSEFTSTSTVSITGSADRAIYGRNFANFGAVTWSDGRVLTSFSGNWVNKAGSTFTIPAGNSKSWIVHPSYGGTACALTIDSGASLIKEGSNDVVIQGPLNVQGNFSTGIGPVSAQGGGSVGHATVPAVASGRIELEGGLFTAINGGKFTSDGGFRVNGGTLVNTVGQQTTFGALDLAPNGIISGAGKLSVTLSSNWTGGTYDDTGVIEFGPACSVMIDGTANRVIFSRTFHNYGQAYWDNGSVYSSFGGNWINKAGSSFTIRNDDDHWRVHPSYGGTATAMTVESGALCFKNTNTNDVTFEGPLNMGGNFTIASGTISGTGGGSIGSTGPAQTGSGGRIELEGGTFTAALGAVYTGTGGFRVNGGRLTNTLGQAATFSNLDLATNGVIGGTGLITVTAGMIWSGGTFDNSGDTAFGPSAIVSIDTVADHIILGRVFQNDGKVTWNNGTVFSAFGGNWINRTGSKFTILNDNDNWLVHPSYGGTPTAFTTEHGSLLVKDTNTNDVLFQGALNIGGDFNMIAGTISGTGGGGIGSATGTSTGLGGRIELEGGTFTAVHGGVYTGPGRFATTGGFASSGGLLNLPAGKSLTLSGLDLDGGGVSGPGTLTVTLGGTWTGGGLFDAGTTIFTNTATMTANSTTAHNIFGRIVQNNGTLNWDNGHFFSTGGGEWTNTFGSKVNITTDDDVWTAHPNYGGTITTFTSTVGSTLTRSGNATPVAFHGVVNAAGDVNVFTGSVTMTGGGSLGTLAVTQGAFRFSGGTFNVVGNATVGGAGGLTIDGTATVNIPTGTSLNATNLVQNGGFIDGPGLFTAGTTSWTGGWQAGSGTTVFSTSVTMSGPNPKVIYGRNIINSGNAVWTAGDMFTSQGAGVAWTNAANSVLDIQGDLVWTVHPSYGGTVVGMATAANGLLKKSAGAGTARFDGPVSNAGTTLVQSGTLQVAGDYVQSGGRTSVQGILDPTGQMNLNGGSLEGTGTILGNVANSGGSVKPGMSPGTLSIVGNYTQSGTGVLDVELNGTGAGLFDKLDVFGSIALGGTVKTAVGYAAATNDKYTVLANDGTDAVAGTFNGLPEGGTFVAGNHVLSVSYVGGDGNDVVLTRVATAAPSVTGFTVNNGAAPRSRLTTITVNFDSPVLAANYSSLGAIKLQRTAVGSVPTGAVGDLVQTGPAAANHITVAQGSTNSLVLTFDNNGSSNNSSTGVENGSLTDGYWKLIIGTFSSTTGDPTLRRFFGDTGSGSGTIDGVDLTAFGNAFNSGTTDFDFNNDGIVDGTDLTAFGNRFGMTW